MIERARVIDSNESPTTLEVMCGGEWVEIKVNNACNAQLSALTIAKAINDAAHAAANQRRKLIVVSLIVINENGCMLLGERKSPIAKGMLSTPGGRCEEDESLQACAVREFKEETGATVHPDDLDFFAWREKFDFDCPRIVFYARLRRYTGAIRNTEPEKCAGWAWWEPARIPLGKCTESADIISQIALGVACAKRANHGCNTARIYYRNSKTGQRPTGRAATGCGSAGAIGASKPSVNRCRK